MVDSLSDLEGKRYFVIVMDDNRNRVSNIFNSPSIERADAFEAIGWLPVLMRMQNTEIGAAVDWEDFLYWGHFSVRRTRPEEVEEMGEFAIDYQIDTNIHLSKEDMDMIDRALLSMSIQFYRDLAATIFSNEAVKDKADDGDEP